MAGKSGANLVGVGAVVAGLVAPAMAFVAALLIRVDPTQIRFAHEVLIGDPGRYAAWFGLGVAVLAVIHALGRFKARGPLALLALMAALASTGLYAVHDRAVAMASPADVSSNPGDPPQGLSGTRAASAPCAGLTPIPKQRVVEEAAYALQQSGFTITQSGLFEIQGERRGFWFQERHSAAVRIRPGRTDVRVVTRNGQPTDTGAACRLALRIQGMLQDKA